MHLRLGETTLNLSSRTHIMGILNVTPDSFSDGGEYLTPKSALTRAAQMVFDGADIIDVGGQSTRPGAEPVSIKTEISRTAPVIEAIAAETDTPVSIDTFNAEVAAAALNAGAVMVNDISGLRFDPGMRHLLGSSGAAVVLMHIKGTPRDMQLSPVYEALVPEVLDYLREGIALAEAAGVEADKIIIDPGIGFGKTFTHNLEIINSLGEFIKLGRPVLAGPSRKAFIGEILGGAPTGERLIGTAAAVTALVLKGASIVRVHDVREMAEAAKVADAIKSGIMPRGPVPQS